MGQPLGSLHTGIVFMFRNSRWVYVSLGLNDKVTCLCLDGDNIVRAVAALPRKEIVEVLDEVLVSVPRKLIQE